MRFDQSNFEIRCEWGLAGLKALAPISDVIVIVDVLSFTTAVDIGTARGGVIFPYPMKGESAASYARSVGANLASTGRRAGYSLSPASLHGLPAGYRLVLPSPNGGGLSFHANHAAVLAGCFRNASAVAEAAANMGSNIAVIPAGEKWPGGEPRPCLEDLAGAGAVISGPLRPPFTGGDAGCRRIRSLPREPEGSAAGVCFGNGIDRARLPSRYRVGRGTEREPERAPAG